MFATFAPMILWFAHTIAAFPCFDTRKWLKEIHFHI